MIFEIEYTGTPFAGTGKRSDYRDPAVRINWRCDILLTRNRQCIENKRVLDIASHDGKFTYALLKLGARTATGVEGRSDLVRDARSNFSKLDLDAEFITSDIFEYLPRITPKTFDTICCFGFYYHTTKQDELVREFSRLQPTYVILDSNVTRDVLDRPYYEEIRESPFSKVKTIDPSGVVLMPNKLAIEEKFSEYGFKSRDLTWENCGIRDWSDRTLNQYRVGERVSHLFELTR
jgi:SAM-dependent methyltransferase